MLESLACRVYPKSVYTMFLLDTIRASHCLHECFPIILSKTLTLSQEVVERAGEAQERLRALDIFRSMSISIEPSPNGQKDSVVVAVRVAEMKTLGGKIGTYVRKNEGR